MAPLSEVTSARLKVGQGTERATPHKLALCVLVKLCVAREGCPLTPTQVRELQQFLVQSIRRVDSILEPVLLETCKELESAISDGTQVAKQLREELLSIDSPDALFDLLESLREILLPASAASTAADVDTSGRPSHIEASGIFGVFLRRVLLSCKRSFEALSRLFHEIGLYQKAQTNGVFIPGITPRAKPYSLKRKMTFEEAYDEGQEEVQEEVHESADTTQGPKSKGETRSRRTVSIKSTGSSAPTLLTFKSFVSRRQLQFHLHRMVEELEAKIGIAGPVEIERQVSEMLAVSPDLPRAHFVRYMNCLLHREYQGAVDSLHTYFDYCMRSGGPTSSAAIATASAAAVAASGGRSTHGAAAIHASATLGRRRPMMQYAVLNLAALHYQFGHRREAMLAIQETVRVAQQNGDHVCVVFALSWLFRLASSHGGQETSQLLRRCLSRAQELGLSHVQGLSHLVTAQYRLLAPSSIPTAMPPPVQSFNAYTSISSAPARSVWRSIDRGVDASVSSVGSYIEAISSAYGAPNGPRTMQQRSMLAMQNDEHNATGMPDQASRAAMAQAIRMVNASLATPSDLYASIMTVAGRAQLLQSVAFEAFGHTSLSWLGALSHLNYFSGRQGTSASDTCLAICRVAYAQAEHGTLGSFCPGNLSVPRSERNAYIGALLLLLEAKKTYRHHTNNIIIQTMTYLLQARAIARGDVLESLMLASTLRSLTPSQQSVFGIGGNFFNDGLHISAQKQWIEALRNMGRLSEAHALTHLLIGKSCGFSLNFMQENLDLTLSQIFLDTGSLAVNALPYTLRCLSRTEKNGQETLYYTASIKLASCQLRMGHVKRAYKILVQALPHVVAHGTLRLTGELYTLLAKCHIAQSKGLQNPVHNLENARQALEKAYLAYMNACMLIDMQEVLYLLARVHNELVEQFRDRDEELHALNLQARDAVAKRFLQLREKQSRPKVRIVGYMNNDEILQQVICS